MLYTRDITLDRLDPTLPLTYRFLLIQSNYQSLNCPTTIICQVYMHSDTQETIFFLVIV